MKRSHTANMAAVLAMAAGGLPVTRGQRTFKMPRHAKRCPQMVTSSPEEIAAWNANVSTRQVKRHAKRQERKTA